MTNPATFLFAFSFLFFIRLNRIIISLSICFLGLGDTLTAFHDKVINTYIIDSGSALISYDHSHSYGWMEGNRGRIESITIIGSSLSSNETKRAALYSFLNMK